MALDANRILEVLNKHEDYFVAGFNEPNHDLRLPLTLPDREPKELAFQAGIALNKAFSHYL